MLIGVDIGASKVAAVRVTAAGAVRGHGGARLARSHAGRAPEAVVAAVDEAIAQAGGLTHVTAVGVGCAGQIDPVTGVIYYSPNLEWDDVPLKDMLEDALNTPIALLNDVQAAALGEHTFGAGRGVDTMIAIFVGSGVGSGLIIDGRLHQGASGSSGEIGHTPYRAHGLKCHCGRRGCYELYCGGFGIERRARRAIARGRSPHMNTRARSTGPTVNTVRRAARAGDDAAQTIWREAVDALGNLVGGYITIINPDLVVLGGGLLAGCPQLWTEAAPIARARATLTTGKAARIVMSPLGDDANALGAAQFAKEVFGDS